MRSELFSADKMEGVGPARPAAAELQDAQGRAQRRGHGPARRDGRLPGPGAVPGARRRRHRQVAQAEGDRRGRAADEDDRPRRRLPRQRGAGHPPHRPRGQRRPVDQRRERAGLRLDPAVRHQDGAGHGHALLGRPVQLRLHRRRPDRGHHPRHAGGAQRRPADLRRPAGGDLLVGQPADRLPPGGQARPGHADRPHAPARRSR